MILKYILRKLNINNVDGRKRQGIFAGLVGIAINLLLFTTKLIIGIWSGALSIIADAFNNLSDMGTSIVMILGFRIAAIPADVEHPFGHGRAENLAGLFVAVAIIFFGVEVLIDSVKTVFEPQEIFVTETTVIVLILSIVAKMMLAKFYHAIGNKISSTAITAAATDSLMDCITTGVVLATMIIYKNFGVNVDALAGIFVAGIILYGGWNALKDTAYPLLGDAPPIELVEGIKNFVTKFPDVIGVHDLIIHNYGAGNNFASMHVELPATLDLLAAHDIADKLERRLNREFNLKVTLHIDPVVDTPENEELLTLARQILKSIDDRLTPHDFRVVSYKGGRKLIFDVAVPEDIILTDRDIRKRFQSRLIKLNPRDRAVIHFDHHYC